MERKPFYWSESFIGNWDLFKEALGNPETIFVYDIDGILANTPKPVFENFYRKTGIKADPAEMNKREYLVALAVELNLGADVIEHADDDWYKPEILLAAQRYLYVKPVVLKTVGFYGPDNNFVLTSREKDVEDVTLKWFARELPQIKPENILMREKESGESSTAFKAREMGVLAKRAPWVVFVDDFTEFCQAVLDAGIENCLVINIPHSKVTPDFSHERMAIIKRHPEDIEAMYPLLFALEKAILVAHS